MNIIMIIASILTIGLVIQECQYFCSNIIKVKNKLDRILMIIVLLFIVLVMIFIAKTWYHYIFGICIMLFIFFDIQKQGLSKTGVLIVARGKQLYRWQEIHHVSIWMLDDVKVIYYSDAYHEIVTHHYPTTNYEEIINLLKINHIDINELTSE